MESYYLRVTGCVKFFDFSPVDIEKLKANPFTLTADDIKNAVIECYKNGYGEEDCLALTQCRPTQISSDSEEYDEQLASDFSSYLHGKLCRGDFNLKGKVSFYQISDFDKGGLCDIYVDTDIDIQREFERYRKERELEKEKVMETEMER